MVKDITMYRLNIIAPTFFVIRHTTDPLPRGTNVWTAISLSQVNTLFSGVGPDPKFVLTAWIESWTTYTSAGTESPPQRGEFGVNMRAINNCARITYALAGERVAGWAQATIFMF
jgi:hypothetical protein